MQKKIPKVSVIISIYKPNLEILEKIRKILKKQTIKAEIIEMENLPEAIAMNTGVKKAKGKIVITLCQDCLPENEYWIEKLIAPLIEEKNVVATVSNLRLPEWYWKKYPFLTRMLILDEVKVTRPAFDTRACAYWKKVLIKAGMFNEDPKVIAFDGDIRKKLEKLGRIANPGVNVLHLHPLTNKKKIELDYKYALASGNIVRNEKVKEKIVFLKRLVRATPILGLVPILLSFPFKKHFLFFPLYVLYSPISHFVYVFGFWKGLIIKD